MRASAAAQLLKAIQARAVPVWVDGGWGVDALVGRETRHHKDLDLMVSASEVSRLTAVLESNGFRLVSGVSGGGLYRDGEDNLVDIGTLSFDEEGRGVYRGGKGGEVRFSSDAFRGHGSIGGVEVRCLTPEAQMQAHSGYEPSPKDAHDVRLLCEAFGLTALPPYRD